MKCVIILKTEEVIRMKNDKAAKLVDTNQAKYCPKYVWKDKGRIK